jgi:hypothetical protein
LHPAGFCSGILYIGPSFIGRNLDGYGCGFGYFDGCGGFDGCVGLLLILFKISELYYERANIVK